MGASAQRPTSGAPGAGGSGFYQNALNQQKQAVANRPGGFSGGDPRQDQGQAAYNQYMQAQQQRMDAQAGQGANQAYKDILGRAPNSTEQSQYETVRKASGGKYNPEDLRNSLRSGAESNMNAYAKKAAAESNMNAYAKEKLNQQRPPVSPKGITLGGGYANRPFG
jgi:hypothetical protein